MRELDLDLVTGQQFRVLPLVYWNLSRHGADGAPLARLKGIYRYTWAGNQIRLAVLADAVRGLARRGPEPKVLGDAALVAGVYRDEGLRVIRRLVVEGAGTAQETVGVMSVLGWEVAEMPGETTIFERRDHRIGRVALELRPAGSKGVGTADPVTRITLAGGVDAPAAGPSELAVSICEEALSGEGGLLLGPAADFHVVSPAVSTVDWTWVIEECRRRGCAPALAALRELAVKRSG